jgi:hypothetical protein
VVTDIVIRPSPVPSAWTPTSPLFIATSRLNVGRSSVCLEGFSLAFSMAATDGLSFFFLEVFSLVSSAAATIGSSESRKFPAMIAVSGRIG